MSDAALLGESRPFQFKGQVYQVSPRDLFIELNIADWCKAEAALAISRLRPRVPADFYAEQMKIYNSKIIGKQISWGSEDVHLATCSTEGERQLLYLKMKRGEEHGGAPVERELIDQIAKDTVKYAELQQIMMEQDYPFLLEPKKATASQKPPAAPASSAAVPDSTPKA